MSKANPQIRGTINQANNAVVPAILQDDSDESLLILETDENNNNEIYGMKGQLQQQQLLPQNQGRNSNYNINNFKRDQSIKQKESNACAQCQAVLNEIVDLLKSGKSVSSKHWKNLEQKLASSAKELFITGSSNHRSSQSCLVKIIRSLNSASLIQIEVMGNPSLAQLILESCEYFTSFLAIDNTNLSSSNHGIMATRNGNTGLQAPLHNNSKKNTSHHHQHHHNNHQDMLTDMTSLTLNSQGTVSCRKGEFHKALELFQNAVSLGGVYLGLSYLNLSVLYSSLGNHNLSLEAANNALIEQQRIFVVAADNREVNTGDDDYADEGGLEQSEERSRQANTLVQAYFNIAVEMEHLQRYDEALRHYENSYLCSQKHLGKKSSITAQFYEEYKLFQSRFASLINNNNNNLSGSNSIFCNNYMNNSTKSMRLLSRTITVRPSTVSPAATNNNINNNKSINFNSTLHSARISNASPNRKHFENNSQKQNFLSSTPVVEYPSPQLQSSVRRRKCPSSSSTSSRQRFSLGQQISNNTPARNNISQSMFFHEKQHSSSIHNPPQLPQPSSLSSSQIHHHIIDSSTINNKTLQQCAQPSTISHTPSVISSTSSSAISSSVPYIFPESSSNSRRKTSRIKSSFGVAASSGSSSNCNMHSTSILHSTRNNAPSANFSFKPNASGMNSSFHNNLGISSGSSLISTQRTKTPFKELLEQQCAVTVSAAQTKKKQNNHNNTSKHAMNPNVSQSFFHFADVEMLKNTTSINNMKLSERESKQQGVATKMIAEDLRNHDGAMSASARTGQSQNQQQQQQQQQLGSIIRMSSTPRNRKKILSSSSYRQASMNNSCSPPSSLPHRLRPASSSSSSLKLSLRHSYFADTTNATTQPATGAAAVSFKDTNDTELQQQNKEHITNNSNSGSFNVLKMLQLKDCLAASAKLVETAILLKEKKQHQCAKHRRIKRLSLQGHFQIADDDNDDDDEDDQGATASVVPVTASGTADKGNETQAPHRTDSEDKCQECESPLRSSSQYTKHGLKLIQRIEDARMSCSEKITEESGTLQFWQVNSTHLIASFITYQENNVHDVTATTMASSNLAQRSHNNSNSNISAAHTKSEIHQIIPSSSSSQRAHPKALFLHCFDASFLDSPGALLISSPIHQDISQILPLLLNKLIPLLQINEDHDCLSLKPSPGNPLRFLLPGGLSFRMYKIADKFSSIAALPRQTTQSSQMLASLSSVISSVKNQSSTESPHSMNMESSMKNQQHKNSLIIKTIQKIKCDKEANMMIMMKESKSQRHSQDIQLEGEDEEEVALESDQNNNPSNQQIPSLNKLFANINNSSSSNSNNNNNRSSGHRLSRESILKMLEIKKTQSLFQLGRSGNLQEINELEELNPIFPRENVNKQDNNKINDDYNGDQANEEAHNGDGQHSERQLPTRSMIMMTPNTNNQNNLNLSSSPLSQSSSPPSSTSISSGSISPLLASKPPSNNIPPHNFGSSQNPQELPAQQPPVVSSPDKPVISSKLIHSSLHHALSINTQFKPHGSSVSTPLIPLPVSDGLNTSYHHNELPQTNSNNNTKLQGGSFPNNYSNTPTPNASSIPNPSLPPQVLHQKSSTTSAGSPQIIGINSPLMPGILSPLVTPTNNIHSKGNYSSQPKPNNQTSNFQQGLSSPFSQISGSSSTNIMAGIGSPQNPLGGAAAVSQNQLIKQFQDCSPINALGSPITSFYEQDPTFTTYWKDISQNVSDLNRQNASPTTSVLSKIPSQQIMAGLSQKSIECYPPGIQQETIQQVQQLKSIINQNKAFQRMEMLQNGGSNNNNNNTISNASDASRMSTNNLLQQQQQQQQQQSYHQGDFSKSLQQQQYIQTTKQTQPCFQQSQVNSSNSYPNQQSQQYNQIQAVQPPISSQLSYLIQHSSSNQSVGSTNNNNNNNNIYNNGMNPYNNFAQQLKPQQSVEQSTQQYQDQRDRVGSYGNNSYAVNALKRDAVSLGQTQQQFQNRNTGIDQQQQQQSYQQQQSQQQQQQPQDDNRDNGTTTTNNNVNGSSNTSLSPANGVYGISNSSSSPANNVFIGQNIIPQGINNNNNNSLPQESKQSMSLSGISRNNDNQQGSLFESKDNDSNDFFKHQESSSSKLKSHASISILPLTNTISSKNELPSTQQNQQQQRRYSQFYLQQQLALAVANLETSQEPVSMISERKDESTQAIVSNNRLQFEPPQQASPAVSSSNTNNQSPQFQSENQLETQQQQQINKFQMINQQQQQQQYPSGISSQLQKQLQLQDRVEIRQIDSKIENEEEAGDRSVSVSNILNNKELREKKQTDDNSIQQSPLLNKTVVYEAKDVASQNGDDDGDDDDNDDCDDDYEENKLLHAQFEKGMITRVESENELCHDDNNTNNNNNNNNTNALPAGGNGNNNNNTNNPTTSYNNNNNNTVNASNTPSNNVLQNQANFDTSSIKIWKGDGVQRHSMDSNSNLFGAPISNISRINKVPSVDNTDNFDGLEGSSCEVADFQNGSMNNPPNIRSTSSLAQQSNQKLSSNNNIVSQSSQDEETSKIQRQSSQTQVQIEQFQQQISPQQQQQQQLQQQQQSPTSKQNQQQSTPSAATAQSQQNNTQNQQELGEEQFQQQQEQDNLKLQMEKLEQRELLLNNGETNPRNKQIQLIRNAKKKPSVPMIIISKVSSASEDDEDEDNDDDDDEDYDSENEKENNQSQENEDEDDSVQSEDQSEDSELDSPVQDLPVSLSRSENPDMHTVQVPSSLAKLANQQSLPISSAAGQAQPSQSNSNTTEIPETSNINNSVAAAGATAATVGQSNPTADIPPTIRSRTQSKGGTGQFQMTESQKPLAGKIHEKRESLMFAGLFRSRAESLMITRDENRSLTPKIKERRDSMLNGDIISFQNQLQIIEQATKQYQLEQQAEQKQQQMNQSSPQKSRRESNRFTHGILDLALPNFSSKMSRIEENHADSEYVDSECDDNHKKHHRNNSKSNESNDKNGANSLKENNNEAQLTAQEQQGLGTGSLRQTTNNIPSTPTPGSSRFHPHNRVKELRLQAMHGQLASGDNHDQQSPYFNLDSNKKGTNSEDDQQVSQNSQNSREGSSKQQQQQQQQQLSQQSITQQSSQQKLAAYEPFRKKVFTFDFHKQDTLTKTKNSQPSLPQLAEVSNMQHSNNTLSNNSINSKNNKSCKSIMNKDSSNNSCSDSEDDS